MKRERGPVLFVTGFYLFIVLPLILWQFLSLRSAVLDGLNRDLSTAAQDIADILGDDFHDLWTPEHPLTPEEYGRIKERLNRYVNYFQIEYAYTMVRREGTVYFVVSNETEEDLERGTPSLFYNPYPDPPADLIRAFDSDRPILSSYTNIWDSYYSFFLPRRTPSGQTYVLAADVKLDFKRGKLNNSLAILGVMIFLALSSLIPFFLLWQRHTRKRADYFRDQYYTDSLTGLPNRARFLEDFRGFSLEPLSAVMIDLDSFRDVNNLFGGNVGDMVLIHTVEIIGKVCSGRSYRLYKFPADEFVLIFPGNDRERAVSTAEEILKAFQGESFSTRGQELHLSLRAGIVHDPQTRRKLLTSVNIATNLAKAEERGLVVYGDEMDPEEFYTRNIIWLNRLKEALAEDRVLPYYQPILNNFTGKIDRYEALVRLISREGEVITPDKFLSVAMRSKLYGDISSLMIRKSLKDFSKSPCSLSLNLSIRDLQNGETVNLLLGETARYAMEGRVSIELLESESLFQVPRLAEILQTFRDRGIRVIIDDFGSGYSNFSYLSSIPLDLLKIDGTLIRGLGKGQFSEAVIVAISAFCRDLGIPLVAEFVEDEETRSRLTALGVEYSQGYLVGKPMPFSELAGENRNL